MQDEYGRFIQYLRFSVTDLCNLRCRYCMSPAGVDKLTHHDILSFEEIETIASVAVDLGVKRIRLTGGEPLVRRGIVDLCRSLAALKRKGLEELCMTSNGLLLDDLAFDLKRAGVDRLNISLDSLDEELYRQITCGGDLKRALRGIASAREAGFTRMKINVVLMGGINDQQISAFCEWTRHSETEIRFIELMPIGPSSAWPKERFVSADTVLERIPELIPDGMSGVARLYRLPKGLGRVGLIRPMSDHFCSQCNRLRVSSDGYLQPCLHSEMEWYLKGLTAAELRAAFIEAVAQKPQAHQLCESGVSASPRRMNQIGG